jgi:4-hydroxy-tetrahydrodipicolinate synthase
MTFRGCGTALATPFTERGEPDLAALAALAEWQIAGGVDFLVPCGSTGEAQTQTFEERGRTVRTVVEAARGRVPVVAGVTSSDTRAAAAEARAMCDLGADAVMSACPYYNRPTQAGLERHFLAIADAIDRPLVVYNVPSRSGINLEPATTLRLAGHPRIVAIKEASGNPGQIARIIAGRPDGFLVLSGDDPLALPVIALGGDGLISVISNAAPAPTAALVHAALAGDLPRARDLHYQLLPLMDACFLESNPIPVKTALALLGRATPAVRLPLLPASPATTAALRRALEAAEALPAEAS